MLPVAPALLLPPLLGASSIPLVTTNSLCLQSSVLLAPVEMLFQTVVGYAQREATHTGATSLSIASESVISPDPRETKHELRKTNHNPSKKRVSCRKKRIGAGVAEVALTGCRQREPTHRRGIVIRNLHLSHHSHHPLPWPLVPCPHPLPFSPSPSLGMWKKTCTRLAVSALRLTASQRRSEERR